MTKVRRNGIVAFSVSALLCLFLGLTWLVWKLHPWMPSGQAVSLGEWRFGGYDFQVWQRRTEYVFEPFATGLFVRRGSNQWQVFCLDHQDVYSPKIDLVRNGADVLVFRGKTELGFFRTLDQSFRKAPRFEELSPMGMGGSGEPPGRWWLRADAQLQGAGGKF